MSIFESLGGLSLDTKFLLAIMVLLWIVSEVRHANRHREDRRTIERLRAERPGSDQAQLTTHRAALVPHGAALSLGEFVPRGPHAGQHFVGTIQNAGSADAEHIRVTAMLGANHAHVLTAPTRLSATDSAPLEVRLPFGFLSVSDLSVALQSGHVLRLQIAYDDATGVPHVLTECFAFHAQPSRPGSRTGAWVSRRARCPRSRFRRTAAH